MSGYLLGMRSNPPTELRAISFISSPSLLNINLMKGRFLISGLII